MPRLWPSYMSFRSDLSLPVTDASRQSLSPLPDLFTNTYFSPRQLVWILPFYLLCVADGILWWLDHLQTSLRLSRNIKNISLAMSCALLFAASMKIYGVYVSDQIKKAENLESILVKIESHLRPGDILGFQSQRIAHEFLFHYDRQAFLNAPCYRCLPQIMRVKHAGNENELRISDLGGAYFAQSNSDSARMWYVAGDMADMSVLVPRPTN